jgi:hypothetical protein
MVPCRRAPRWVEVGAGQNHIGGGFHLCQPDSSLMYTSSTHPPGTSSCSDQPYKWSVRTASFLWDWVCRYIMPHDILIS